MSKTKITKIKGDWQEVANDCRTTVGKDELGKEPSKAFKIRLLIAEHSPIRDIIIKWRWNSIKSWIATHWVRHKWECFVRTQRTDRTGVNRDDLPQSALVDFVGEANVQHLIDTWRKRLCRQASPETREYAEDFKVELRGLQAEISDVLVPNCVYRCGCPELDSCAFWRGFVEWCAEDRDAVVEMLTIRERYELYNEYFYLRKDGKNNEAH